MRHYAGNTSVSPDKSRAEIEKTLTRYGAVGFMYGWNEHGAVIGFMMRGKQYKCVLHLPNKDDFLRSEKGRRRTALQAQKAWDQATKQRWRALALVIKAKLEAVEIEISTVESEFLNWMVLPNGQTVGDALMPKIEEAYQTGKMPKLLPGILEGEIHE